MADSTRYVIGTSGYSFADWVGTFYPPGTAQRGMFAQYVRHFATVELNFTFYRLPTARTLESLGSICPADFTFWVKANQKTTHERDRTVAGEFLANLQPLRSTGKLAGVLMQFPQSFHRTVENRKYLAAAVEDFASVPLAAEFRHRSWDHVSTVASLRERNVTLVIPDVPEIPGLYRPSPAVTTRTGYLRLHSRDADKWYAGMADRYDYSYSDKELGDILTDWYALEKDADKVYAFFNNCHRGQAAGNAEAFRRILGQIPSDRGTVGP